MISGETTGTEIMDYEIIKQALLKICSVIGECILTIFLSMLILPMMFILLILPFILPVYILYGSFDNFKDHFGKEEAEYRFKVKNSSFHNELPMEEGIYFWRLDDKHQPVLRKFTPGKECDPVGEWSKQIPVENG